ncbi:MAG: type I restriction endonuclease subunit R, partial [Mycoplasmataceae bacterium RV_VA103A]
TATPIEGKTEKEIGPIIHTYSVNKALENEIIVPITYEKAYEHLPKVYWDEEEFAKNFPKKEETFFDKKKSTKNKKDILFESPERTAAMCEFFKKDYENFSRHHYVKSQPKVMYMAYNVDAAHNFFKELQKDPNYQNKSCLVVSKKNRNHSSGLISDIGNEKENIQKFKDPQSDLNIVIVVDKLTTGFNMENLERIYLDQQIDASHSFFQKISRVNRKYSYKDRGFVVDLVGNEKTYQRVLNEYFSDRDSKRYINSGKIENLWNFFVDFHSQEELYRLLFVHQQINEKAFFDEALNYCLKKNEEERRNFFSETKSLRLTLGSQWYINKENDKRQENLDFVNWCFRLGWYFTFDAFDEPVEGNDEKKYSIEPKKVEKASEEAIKISKIDFNTFDFSQIKKEIMSIDPKKYPDAYRWVLKSRIKNNLGHRQKWWFSVKEWEDKFLYLLEEYNKKKINSHDLNSKLKELDEELEKENQKIIEKLEKDAHYPLRKKLMEKLTLDKRENDSFIEKLIEYFLKLNKDIPDWILREEERKKARKEIDEKNKRHFGEKMPQQEREELVLLLENYFMSEYYAERKF